MNFADFFYYLLQLNADKSPFQRIFVNQVFQLTVFFISFLCKQPYLACTYLILHRNALNHNDVLVFIHLFHLLTTMFTWVLYLCVIQIVSLASSDYSMCRFKF
jgi:hypothetical protein